MYGKHIVLAMLDLWSTHSVHIIHLHMHTNITCDQKRLLHLRQQKILIPHILKNSQQYVAPLNSYYTYSVCLKPNSYNLMIILIFEMTESYLDNKKKQATDTRDNPLEVSFNQGCICRSRRNLTQTKLCDTHDMLSVCVTWSVSPDTEQQS